MAYGRRVGVTHSQEIGPFLHLTCTPAAIASSKITQSKLLFRWLFRHFSSAHSVAAGYPAQDNGRSDPGDYESWRKGSCYVRKAGIIATFQSEESLLLIIDPSFRSVAPSLMQYLKAADGVTQGGAQKHIRWEMGLQ
jgi:hypothetical protein